MIVAVVIIALAVVLLILRSEECSIGYIFGCSCLALAIALGVYLFAREFAKQEIGNYIQHPEEYQIDTISVNGVIDHYEVEKL